MNTLDMSTIVTRLLERYSPSSNELLVSKHDSKSQAWIGAHNWYTTENYAIVDPLFAKILFLIRGEISFNFGKLAFDLIVKNANVF